MARRFINHEYFITHNSCYLRGEIKTIFNIKKRKEIYNKSNNSVRYIVIRILNRKRERQREREREREKKIGREREREN